MGLTIRGDFDGSPSYDMGLGSFFQLRRDIAFAVSREFGEHYQTLLKCSTEEDFDAYDRTLAELVRKYEVPEGTLKFLFEEDGNIRIAPVFLQPVYDLALKLDPGKRYGYGGWPKETQMTGENFQELLKFCMEEQKPLMWKTA